LLLQARLWSSGHIKQGRVNAAASADYRNQVTGVVIRDLSGGFSEAVP